MRTAVMITSGIGNAIFSMPLIKHLSKHGELTLFATSSFGAERIFGGAENPEIQRLTSIQSSVSMIWNAIMNLGRFDTLYIDHFGASRRNFIFAALVSKHIVTSKIPTKLHPFFRKKIRLVTPIAELHEGSQLMRFADENFKDDRLDASMFSLQVRGTLPESIKSPFITIQPGAGNDNTPWKIWPLTSWINLIQALVEAHPEIQIVVLGDKNDKKFAPYFDALGGNVLNLIDQTLLEDLPYMLSKSMLHIGGDSGLLHVAGAVETKTITICGGSDSSLFGWHKIDPKKHRILEHKMPCHPCYRYYLPNRSRVQNASECPDFKCIQGITVKEVTDIVTQQFQSSDQ